MVKLLLFLTLTFSSQIFANELNATVVVLEAPVFRSPILTSSIFQYYRKGQQIYIHKDALTRDVYTKENFRTKKDAEVVYIDNPSKDPLFEKSMLTKPHPDFYRTLTKSGAVGYVYKQHIEPNYNDVRELNRENLKVDPTDYRIAEPLPKGYPLIKPSVSKGHLVYSMGLPTNRAHPYKEAIRDSGFKYNKEILFTWSREVSFDLRRRFFFGGMTYLKTGQQTYTLDNYNAKEDTLKVGIGPYLSYDAWRSTKLAFNIYSSLGANLVDKVTINQKDNTQTINEEREYSTLSLSAQFGAMAVFKKVMSDLDLVIGAQFTYNFDREYKSDTPIDVPQIWENKYSHPWNTQLNYFFGIQKGY